MEEKKGRRAKDTIDKNDIQDMYGLHDARGTPWVGTWRQEQQLILQRLKVIGEGTVYSMNWCFPLLPEAESLSRIERWKEADSDRCTMYVVPPSVISACSCSNG